MHHKRAARPLGMGMLSRIRCCLSSWVKSHEKETRRLLLSSSASASGLMTMDFGGVSSSGKGIRTGPQLFLPAFPAGLSVVVRL
jgi:hypothetical protein